MAKNPDKVEVLDIYGYAIGHGQPVELTEDFKAQLIESLMAK